MRNVEFTYLYRDGGNYKKWGRVIFSNPTRLRLNAVEKALRANFMADGLFIADQIRLPEVFFNFRGEATSDDHCFHEYYSLTETRSKPNDGHLRSIGAFISEVRREARRGWREFDPTTTRC